MVESADEDADAAADVDAAPGDPVQEFKDALAAKFGDWYVVHSYAGYENRVKANLENRTTSLNMEDFIFEAEVPMEEVTEIKNGQKKLVAPRPDARIRAGPDGPHRRVVGRRAPHARASPASSATPTSRCR